MELVTERLILRKARMSDAKTFAENNDIVAIRDFFAPFPGGKKDFEKLMQICIDQWDKDKRYWFILELRNNGEAVGLCGIKDIQNYNKTGYLSSWIFKKYRRKGYALEAKIAVNEFAFNKLKLRKLKSEVATFNKNSNLLQKKFGMKLEGCLRKENFNPYLKKYADMNLYSLFKEDWKKNLPKLKNYLKEKIKKLENKK